MVNVHPLVALFFAGFIILIVFGTANFDATIEAEEFGTCYEYFDDSPPVEVSCDAKLQNKVMFLGLVMAVVGAGIVSLVKGVRGKWDQDVRPEDMVGPSNSDAD